MMSQSKKIDLPAGTSADAPVTITAQHVLELTQSYATIAKHSARIAHILRETIGIDEKTINAAILASDTAGDADNKKRKRERDPDAPKRPASSFLLFMSDQRPILKTKNPDMTYTDLMKEIGTLWKLLPEAQREVYESRYNASKEEFAKQQEQYLAKKNSATNEADNKPVPVASPKKQKAETTNSKLKKPKQKAPPAPVNNELSESEISHQESASSSSSEAEVENSKPKKETPTTPTKKAKKPNANKPAVVEKKEPKETKVSKEAKKPAPSKANNTANNNNTETTSKKSKKAKKTAKAQ